MRSLVVIAAVLGLGGVAHAGVFGGFSAKDPTYLKGTDQVCNPIPVGLETAAPRCQKTRPEVIAAGKFRKPPKLAGAKVPYRVASAGTTLTVTPTVGKPFTWSSVDPIVGVDGVYHDANHNLLAVELRTRMGSRQLEDVIVFQLRRASRDDAVEALAKDAVIATPPRSKAAGRAIAAGHKQLARKRWSAAAAQFRKALAETDDPEARYGLAVALARTKKLPEALVELEAIATSKQPNAVLWKVVARHDVAFRGLVADKRFRAAVGIDARPGAALTAYERLVGSSHRWEQSEVKCDRPQVNLDLRRQPQTFKLVIKTTCGGYTDRTRLAGTYQARGGDRVDLTFPNPGGKAEVFGCSLARATDGSGDDVLTCAAGTDMEMVLRTVHR